MGNRHPSIAPYELIGCADGDLVLAVGNDRQSEALCRVVQRAGISDDPRFATNAARVENREALGEIMSSALACGSTAEWAALLTAERVPVGVVDDIAGAFAFAETLRLDPQVTLARDDGGTVRLTRDPIDLSVTPVTYRHAPPRYPGARSSR